MSSMKVTSAFHKIQKALKHHDEYKSVYDAIVGIPFVNDLKKENRVLKKELEDLKELVFKYERILHFHDIQLDYPVIHVEKIKTEPDLVVEDVEDEETDVVVVLPKETPKPNIVYELIEEDDVEVVEEEEVEVVEEEEEGERSEEHTSELQSH